MAVAMAIDKGFFKESKHNVDISLNNDVTRGQTIADRRESLPKELKKPPNVNIAYWVDGPRFLQFFVERIS